MIICQDGEWGKEERGEKGLGEDGWKGMVIICSDGEWGKGRVREGNGGKGKDDRERGGYKGSADGGNVKMFP